MNSHPSTNLPPDRRQLSPVVRRLLLGRRRPPYFDPRAQWKGLKQTTAEYFRMVSAQRSLVVGFLVLRLFAGDKIFFLRLLLSVDHLASRARHFCHLRPGPRGNAIPRSGCDLPRPAKGGSWVFLCCPSRPEWPVFSSAPARRRQAEIWRAGHGACLEGSGGFYGNGEIPASTQRHHNQRRPSRPPRSSSI